MTNLETYSNGFSFTVKTELEAYKEAHKYQHCKETIVKFAPNVGEWLIQVFN